MLKKLMLAAVMVGVGAGAWAAPKTKVQTLKPGEWVRGRGWDEGKLAERRYITAADLDKVAPNNPVWLTQTTGHYGVGNSLALKMAEVRKETKDPPAGTIDRDAQGNPTGVMKEAAQGLITALVPPMTREQQKRGIEQIIADFNREGMTGAKDPGIRLQKWEIYEELLEEGRLNAEAKSLVRFQELDLMSGEFPSNYHLILCRNVIIYFERAVQERLFHKFHKALDRDGVLVLGKVETIIGDASDLFKPLASRERIFSKV